MTISSDFGTANSLPVSVTIPGYRLRRQVGSDAIGFWLDAEQESLERKVTVKVLKPEFEHHEGARREFEKEMDRLSPLAHPNLLRVLDSTRDETLLLVTERIGQHTLHSLLQEGKQISENAAIGYTRGVARALHYLTEKGLAHKNVSPRMVALLEEGACRLVTFRNIIPLEELAGLRGRLTQDPNYVAPEQLAGEDEIGPRTHCYHVGALLFHLLAGQPAHLGSVPKEVAKAHLTQEFPSLKRKRPFLAKGIYETVAAATVKDPDDRPDLDQLLAALDALLDGKDPGLRAKGTPSIVTPRPRRRRRRR